MRRALLIVALVVLAAVVGGLAYGLGIAGRVGAGITAHVVCSLHHNTGLEPEAAFEGYVRHIVGPGGPLLSIEVHPEASAVDARAFGLLRTRAVYTPGRGCTVLAEDAAPPRALPGPLAEPLPPLPPDLPWPEGSAPAPPAPPAVAAALDRAFAELPGDVRQTTAVVVAHRGRLVAERYAPGVGPRTPLISWSMAKSLLATLIGLAGQEQRLDLRAPAPVPEWQGPGDPRGAITLDQLLRMSSGLAFDETYGPTNDVSRMLFTHADAGAFAAAFPLAHPPDAAWSYSSGTSNLLARVLRDEFRDYASMARWTRGRLFQAAGMTTAFFEADASGSFIGSSFAFMSARDWARFGELHRRDGLFRGRRVLPEGWVQYVSTPTPEAPDGRYGAGWWLNAGDPSRPEGRTWPSVPRDAYAARGFSGQYVVVIPSAELVVVRTGLARAHTDEAHGIEALLREVIAAVGEDGP